MFIFLKRFLYKNSVLLALVWGLFILISCALPGNYFPSNNWLSLLSIDKFIHVLMFLILNSLIFIALIKHNKNQSLFFIFLLVCIIYGAFIEWMQGSIFINRSADWKDVVANSVGCLFSFLGLKKMKVFFNT